MGLSALETQVSGMPGTGQLTLHRHARATHATGSEKAKRRQRAGAKEKGSPKRGVRASIFLHSSQPLGLPLYVAAPVWAATSFSRLGACAQYVRHVSKRVSGHLCVSPQEGHSLVLRVRGTEKGQASLLLLEKGKASAHALFPMPGLHTAPTSTRTASATGTTPPARRTEHHPPLPPTINRRHWVCSIW